MKAVVKFVMWPLAGVVLILAAVAAYVAATFDPNRYKPQIVQAVKDGTQRNLRLEGDIKLVLFPVIGAALGKASLSERGSDEEFAGVDAIHVALKLAPLLSKQVVVETVEVRNLRARLVRFRDGTTNIDDLTGGGRPATAAQVGEMPIKVDIEHVTIENAAITYTDEAAGATYALSNVYLETGRIASGVPGRIDLSFTVHSDKPVMNLETVLKATVTFDLDEQSYELTGIDFGARGLAAGIGNLVTTVKGDMGAKFASREFLISGLTVALSGKREGGDLNAKFDVPKLTVTNEHVSGEKLMLDATLSTGTGKLVAKLEIPGIDGNARAFKAGASTAGIDVQQDGARIKARLTSPLAGSVEGQKLELPKLVASVNVNNPGLLKNPLAVTINASAQVDFARQNVSLAFTAKFDDSAINGKAGVTKFALPLYTFDIDIDQLDADRYVAQPDPKQKPEQPFDLAALKDLRASGSLRIGVFKLSNVKATNARIDFKAAEPAR